MSAVAAFREPREAAAAAEGGRVGPNAVIQTAAALEALEGAETARRVFTAAGLTALYGAPPEDMVDEQIAAALFSSTRSLLGPERAAAVLRDSGARTAEYVIANRIPRVARLVLRLLPMRLAARLLTRAIARNAWTFCGSGVFRACIRADRPDRILLSITGGPLIERPCDWHVAVFERLYQRLAGPAVAVREDLCADGFGAARRFTVAL